MDNPSWKAWGAGVSYGLENGMAVIPYALLKHYRKLGLSGSEAMLLIHLISFRQVEGVEFPSLEDLQAVTGRSLSVIAGELQKLLKEGFLSIEEGDDEWSGIHYERYAFSGLYAKLGHLLAAEHSRGGETQQGASGRPAAARLHPGATEGQQTGTPPAAPQESADAADRNLFAIFEKEFGRPLSPMECETISGWLDQDRYPEELILLALKESVFAGKVHFRYIDRILLEWSRNRVKNAQDVKQYAQKFRGGR